MSTFPTSEQQPQGMPPEAKLVTQGEQVPMAEQPTAGVPPKSSGQPAQPPLSAADVSAAIAAMPGPSALGAAAQTQMPTTAADQDLVEPEWVDAAEKTIEATAGNPYAEEEAVEALQIDYLKKRYGYEVKKPEEK